jgi:hypothetical protein
MVTKRCIRPGNPVTEAVAEQDQRELDVEGKFPCPASDLLDLPRRRIIEKEDKLVLTAAKAVLAGLEPSLFVGIVEFANLE